MTVDHAVNLGQQALMTVMMMAAPPLLAALVVGTAVSLLQTVTQLQEVTLSFIPKMAAVFVVLGLMGGWMLQIAVGFGTSMFLSIGSGSAAP
ncbi:MAG: flagellar biosynthetic protein FliQ [Myxococcota bacterium]